MPLIFGYGSLLSPASVSLTALRAVLSADLLPAYLDGYRRTWTASASVLAGESDNRVSCKALFLDLSKDSKTACNGVIVQITEQELRRFDIREKQYERLAVEARTAEGKVSAFTYVIPEGKKTNEGIVLENYIAIINNALKNYPDEFTADFWRSTDPIAAQLVKGDLPVSR